MSSSAGVAELQRRRELDKKPQRESRAQFWTDLCREMFAGARSIFIFLLGITILVLVTSHRAEIDSAAEQKINGIAARIKRSEDASPIRQSALNHENEVAEAAK